MKKFLPFSLILLLLAVFAAQPALAQRGGSDGNGESKISCGDIDPADLVVSDISLTGATVTWPDNGAVNVTVQVHEVGTIWTGPISTNGNSIDLSNLEPCTDYELRLRIFCDDDGDGFVDLIISQPITFSTLCCENIDPADISISNITGTSATVSWPDNGAIKYSVQVHEVGTAWNAPVTANGTSFDMTNLDPCTDYEVRLRIFCDNDGDGWVDLIISQPVTFSTLCCGDIDPSDIVVSDITVDGATVTWPDNGAFNVTVQVHEVGTAWNGPIQANGNTIDLTNLDPCTDYEVRLRIFCDNDGNGIYDLIISQPVTFSTVCCDDIDPSDIVVSDITVDGATVTWPDNGAVNVTVQVHEVGTAWNGPMNANGNTIDLTNLDPCTDYEVRLRIFCDNDGNGIVDLIISQAVPFTTVCCDDIDPADIVVSDITATGATVTWPDNGAVNVTVQVHEVGTAWTGPIQANGNTIDLENLDPCTDYEVRLRIFCDNDGNGIVDLIISQPVTFTTECCDNIDPADIVVSDISLTGATVTWPNNGAVNVTVQVREVGTAWAAPIQPTGNSIDLTNLDPCTDYEVRLRIFCDNDGNGIVDLIISQPVTFTTACCGVLTAADLTFTNITMTSVTVNWPNNGGVAWVIQWEDANGNWNPSPPPFTLTPGYTITGLTPCSPYRVRVNTYCDYSSSPFIGEKAGVQTACMKTIHEAPVTNLTVYPNPFSTVTQFRIENSEAGEATVRVFDLNGKVVAEPMPATSLEAGTHEIQFDASTLPGGMYIAELRVNKEVKFQRISIQK